MHLWDIHKATPRACLGVLNQENDTSKRFANSNDFAPWKKQRFEFDQSNRSLPRMQEGTKSHGGTVMALTFAPGRDDLVSVGLDRRIHHWNLRPDSCFVESVAAIGGGNNKRKIVLRRENVHAGGVELQRQRGRGDCVDQENDSRQRGEGRRMRWGGGNNNDGGNSIRCTIVLGVRSRSAIRRNIYSFQYIACISCVG